MNCPACNAKDTMKWVPPGYECWECGYELTRRDLQRELESDWDNWLAAPPEQDSQE